MSLFDRFSRTANCPLCRFRGARLSWFKVRCQNPQCQKYDAALAGEAALQPALAPQPLPVPPGSFDGGLKKIEIRYRNFQGLDRRYVGDSRSLKLTGRHVSMRAVPTGEWVSFDKRYIQNWPDVERALQAKGPQPSGIDRQILGYHLQYKTTSPRFEEIRKQYPDWTP